MASIRGGSAGLLTGVLISPISCLLTFLILFFLGLMSLARVSVFDDLYDFVLGLGNPYVWTILITCGVFTIWGFFRDWRFFSLGA